MMEMIAKSTNLPSILLIIFFCSAIFFYRLSFSSKYSSLRNLRICIICPNASTKHIRLINVNISIFSHSLLDLNLDERSCIAQSYKYDYNYSQDYYSDSLFLSFVRCFLIWITMCLFNIFIIIIVMLLYLFLS